MADITIYKPATVTVSVIDGDPPVDQTAQITALTQQVAALQAKIDAAKVAAQADKDADNANIAGQGVLNALA